MQNNSSFRVQMTDITLSDDSPDEESKFFAKQSPSSRIKAEIISAYFISWAQNRIQTLLKQKNGHDRFITYVDLFAGPGKYDDGELSTPLLVLNHVNSTPLLKQFLHCAFNDASAQHINALKQNVAELHISGMRSEPEFRVGMVDAELTNLLSQKDMENTLMFVDPFGYKGLSLDLLETALKAYGTDVIFFLNFNRLRMGINNPIVQNHIEAIFGDVGYKILKENLPLTNDKEDLLLKSLFGALKAKQWDYFSVFKFFSQLKDDTSHFLILVSKHPRAFEYMQSIMAKKSSHTDPDAFSSFSFDPKGYPLQLRVQSNLSVLASELERTFAGKRIKLDDLYNGHGPGKPYVRKNYVAAVWRLFDDKVVSFEPRVPRRNTCSESITISFKA